MLLYLYFFLLLIVNETNQDHWRGGTISWAPVENSVVFPIASANVSIRQRYFDLLGYDDDDSCKHQLMSQRALIK